MTRCWLLITLLLVTACSSDDEVAADCLGRSVPAASLTGTAQLTWQAPQLRTDGTPLDDLSGYRIYYGVEPDERSCKIEISDAKAVAWTVSELSPGTWHFAVVSVDAAGVESEASDIVTKRID